MDKKQILESIKLAREISKKRNFKQSFDLVVNLKNLNIKKADENIDLFIQVPYNLGKEVKICALVDYDLEKQAKESCDLVILKDSFSKYENKKKELKKLARSYNFFIAQADIMPKVATLFGKILGPLGKMPNPKVGAVVPGNIATLKILVEKLKNTIRLQTKNELTIKVLIGKEEMKDEEIVENAFIIYNTLLQSLPQEKNNIKSSLIKLSMGPPAYLNKEYKKEEIIELTQKPKVKENAS